MRPTSIGAAAADAAPDLSARPLEPWDVVKGMEEPFQLIEDFADAIYFVAMQIEDAPGRVIRSLAFMLLAEQRRIEEARGQLFHALHPRRAEFEREAKAS